ncbi:MAG: hypothetical protein RR067_05095, partial [Bacilli bacterium]
MKIKKLIIFLLVGIAFFLLITSVMKYFNIKDLNENMTRLVHEIEGKCKSEQLKDKQEPLIYMFNHEGITPNIETNFKLPNKGVIVLNEQCQTKMSVTNEKYVFYKDYDENLVKYKEGKEIEDLKSDFFINGTEIYFDPIKGKVCKNYEISSSTTENKTGCMKWYTFNDINKRDEINLILDHNTTGLIEWNKTGKNIEGPKEELNLLVSENKWTVTPRLITAEEVSYITRNNQFDILQSTKDNWYYLETNSQATVNTKKYSWLHDRTSKTCKEKGCLNNSVGVPELQGYWTSSKTAKNDTDAWAITNGKLESMDVDTKTFFGIRPVITIKKNLINK